MKIITLLLLALFLVGCKAATSESGSPTTTTTTTTTTSSTPSTISQNLVLVTGGSFTLGNDTVTASAPAHLVTVSDFYISKYETTYDDYDKYVAATGATKPSGIYGNDYDSTEDASLRGTHPVTNVSRYDAIQFLNWLSKQDGLTPVYTIDTSTTDSNNTDTTDSKKWTITPNWSANGYRLPTEAEWEFAAKGGTLTKGYTYSGSSTANDVAYWGGKSATSGGTNTAGNYVTALVGSYKANELGVYDLTGNVSEIVWDHYDTSRVGYSATMTAAAIASPTTVATVNPHGIDGTYNRFLMRGGQSNSPATCLVLYKRFTKKAGGMACNPGFRAVKNKA